MKRLSVMFRKISLLGVLLLSHNLALAEKSTFSEAEIDQMMAPIALYPDALLSQILMASTYPADVAEAVAWSQKNNDMEGDAAVKAVQNQAWDPSVMSLVAFPQVLDMMGKQPKWVENVGDAFLADSDAVMDSVQKLRRKAREEGNLETTKEQKVIVKEQPSETIVIIEPAKPQVVYVPVYNPTIVYGTWWWPYYRPWYYYPPGYAFGTGLMRGIGFGIGVGITHALWGGCHWGRGYNRIDINVNRYNNININKIDARKNTVNWKHNANNRRGVPYRDARTRQQFEKKRPGAEKRMDYRGRDAQREKARATLNKRAINPSEGRKQLQGPSGNKARSTVNQINRDRVQNRKYRGELEKSLPSRSTRDLKRNEPSRDFARQPRTRDHALSGASRPQQSFQSINRGTASNRSMRGGGNFQRSGGGRHGSGLRR